MPFGVALLGGAVAAALSVEWARSRVRWARYHFLKRTRIMLRPHERRGLAGATYMAVADEADLTFRVIAALEAAAQLHARTGNHAEAAAVYQRLADMAPEASAEHQVYRMRLAEQEALAGQ